MTDINGIIGKVAPRGGDSAKIDTPDEGARAAKLLQKNIGRFSASDMTKLREACTDDITLYEVFGDKAQIAKVEAESAFNFVEISIQRENSLKGGEPYVLDLDAHPFPKPETYLHKYAADHNGKSSPTDAYYLWKAAVSEWKNACVEEARAKTDATLTGVSNQVAHVQQSMDEGFMQTYINQGLTAELITQVWKDLDGDIEKVKEELNKRASELKAGQARISGQVAEVGRQVEGVRADLQKHDRRMTEQHEFIVNDNREQAAQTRDTVRNPIRGRSPLKDPYAPEERPAPHHFDEPNGDETRPVDDPDVNEGVEGAKKAGEAGNPEPAMNPGMQKLEDLPKEDMQEILIGILRLGEKAGEVAQDRGMSPPPTGTKDFEEFLKGLPLDAIQDIFGPYLD